jgi:hypothetical protein
MLTFFFLVGSLNQRFFFNPGFPRIFFDQQGFFLLIFFNDRGFFSTTFNKNNKLLKSRRLVLVESFFEYLVRLLFIR